MAFRPYGAYILHGISSRIFHVGNRKHKQSYLYSWSKLLFYNCIFYFFNSFQFFRYSNNAVDYAVIKVFIKVLERIFIRSFYKKFYKKEFTQLLKISCKFKKFYIKRKHLKEYYKILNTNYEYEVVN